MTGVRRWATVTAVAVALLAAVVLALAFAAQPASAFGTWEHDGATDCSSCHSQGTPTNAACTGCHTGFRASPGMNCWSCHAPGQDTSTLSSPSSACTQECHLWDSFQKAYVTPTTHGTNPHLGATADCLSCHATSPGIADPGSSPHHSGATTGFDQCGQCHSSQQRHAGKVSCTSCHPQAEAFHLYKASSPGFKKCGSCHTMKHAGVRVAQSKCTACHKGTSGRAPQHSATVTKNYKCGACHSQQLHASRVSGAVKSCRTCHSGKYHRVMPIPSRSVCASCHGRALSHANGYQCTLCHRRAVHNSRPNALP